MGTVSYLKLGTYVIDMISISQTTLLQLFYKDKWKGNKNLKWANMATISRILWHLVH